MFASLNKSWFLAGLLLCFLSLSQTRGFEFDSILEARYEIRANSEELNTLIAHPSFHQEVKKQWLDYLKKLNATRTLREAWKAIQPAVTFLPDNPLFFGASALAFKKNIFIPNELLLMPNLRRTLQEEFKNLPLSGWELVKYCAAGTFPAFAHEMRHVVSFNDQEKQFGHLLLVKNPAEEWIAFALGHEVDGEMRETGPLELKEFFQNNLQDLLSKVEKGTVPTLKQVYGYGYRLGVVDESRKVSGKDLIEELRRSQTSLEKSLADDLKARNSGERSPKTLPLRTAFEETIIDIKTAIERYKTHPADAEKHIAQLISFFEKPIQESERDFQLLVPRLRD